MDSKSSKNNKFVSLSNLSILCTCKNTKSPYKNNKFKISAPTWNEEFTYLMDHILHQIFKITLNVFKKIVEKRLIILQEEYM